MVTIVDYGSGNLRSVQKAFEKLGTPARITADPQVVAESERVVLPGVGAFGDAMRALRDRGLVEPIVAHVRADKPFFGICMGLQLLFETGLEGGRHDGLGLLSGEVVRFDLPAGIKIPHMGWNTVQWREPGIGGGDDWFYFVHSYHARPSEAAVIAAVTDYGGEFVSAVSRGRLFATQFHPEKSQSTGLGLLASFVGRG
jgi:glutamine amidotransferase